MTSLADRLARRRLRRCRSPRCVRPDRGVTLTELLVVMVVSGVVLAAVSAASTAVIRSAPQAELRLAESKDITFLQAWIPVDLATAINSYTTSDDVALRQELLTNDPHVAYSEAARDALPGTNVLTLVVPDAESGEIEIISYRYHQEDGDWLLSRTLITNPGTAGETISTVGVAHEVPSPPDGWAEGDPVDHAFELTSRNQASLRPVGEDVTVRFESGNEFRTGGAGLSAERDLTPNDPVTLPDPTAPPTRCGGRIAIVIDTSGSVPANRGGLATEQAAVGFIDAFVGTPTFFSINGFDANGYGMINDPAYAEGDIRKYVSDERGPFLSILDDDAAVAMMRDRITRLDDLDGAWPGGGADISRRDPNGDRVMWDQAGSGTNWEDGLYRVFFDSVGQPHSTNQPDLVVLITDGQPNRIRTADGGSAGTNSQDATDRAAAVANDGRAQGSRVIGVMVGNKATNETYVGYLADVVGGNRWNGTVDASGTVVDVGNAVAADLFTGSFDQLGGVLRSIMIAECGGTVTVRKAMDDGSAPTGRWTYSTETGNQVLDLDVSQSVTFDFTFDDGAVVRTVTIREEARDGTSFVRADCELNGAPIGAPKVQQLGGSGDEFPGVQIDVRPDEAVSCVMVSAAE